VTALLALALFAAAPPPAAPLPPPDPPRAFAAGAGAAVDLDAPRGAGVALFVEYEALDELLELELGGQEIGAAGRREFSGDLIAKWPRRVATHLELMVGAGPTLVAERGAKHTTALGLQAAIDLMWWPRPRLGFWVEPTYEVLLRSGPAGALGCTVGPMVGW